MTKRDLPPPAGSGYSTPLRWFEYPHGIGLGRMVWTCRQQRAQTPKVHSKLTLFFFPTPWHSSPSQISFGRPSLPRGMSLRHAKCLQDAGTGSLLLRHCTIERLMSYALHDEQTRAYLLVVVTFICRVRLALAHQRSSDVKFAFFASLQMRKLGDRRRPTRGHWGGESRRLEKQRAEQR